MTSEIDYDKISSIVDEIISQKVKESSLPQIFSEIREVNKQLRAIRRKINEIEYKPNYNEIFLRKTTPYGHMLYLNIKVKQINRMFLLKHFDEKIWFDFKINFASVMKQQYTNEKLFKVYLEQINNKILRNVNDSIRKNFNMRTSSIIYSRIQPVSNQSFINRISEKGILNVGGKNGNI